MKKFVLAKLDNDGNFKILCLSNAYLKKECIRKDSNLENNWKIFKNQESAFSLCRKLNDGYNVYDINEITLPMYKYDNSGIKEVRVISSKINEYCNGKTDYFKTKKEAVNDGVNWIKSQIQEYENEIKEKLNFINEYKTELLELEIIKD